MTEIRTILPLVLDTAPQPVLVADSDGRILYVNPATMAALGYRDQADLLGQDGHEKLHSHRPDGKPYPASECPIVVAGDRGVPAHGDDEWFMHSDGSFFPATWWVAPIDLPGGSGLVYSFLDATEIRELENAVRERDAARIRAEELRAAQRRIMESISSARRQTARDIHDGVQQRLVSLMLCLRMARELVPPDTDGKQRELLDTCVEQLTTGIEDLRRLAAGLHPSMLTIKGLVPAVQELARLSAMPVSVDGDGVGRLPGAVESNAYYIVAEALTNAVKHSGASKVDISISLGATLDIVVTDDGVGGVSRIDAGGGLIGLADRVAAFEGSLSIDSPAGAGTRIEARIPLPGGR